MLMQIIPSRTMWGTSSSSRIALISGSFGSEQDPVPYLPCFSIKACKFHDLVGADIIPEPGIVRVQERPFATECNRLESRLRVSENLPRTATTPRSMQTGRAGDCSR